MVVDDVLGGRESGLVALRGRQRERRQQPRSDDPCRFRTSQIAVNYVLTQLQTTTRSVEIPSCDLVTRDENICSQKGRKKTRNQTKTPFLPVLLDGLWTVFTGTYPNLTARMAIALYP